MSLQAERGDRDLPFEALEVVNGIIPLQFTYKQHIELTFTDRLAHDKTQKKIEITNIAIKAVVDPRKWWSARHFFFADSSPTREPQIPRSLEERNKETYTHKQFSSTRMETSVNSRNECLKINRSRVSPTQTPNPARLTMLGKQS
ncbi:hypothetical protein VTN00DRAFT_5291 [Thermoascus crustaceus]|uniref:uncharacterized protein n=1 Tax=Thermoascus crustaceus TaxID=5088 RepID=UPI0037420B10